MKIYNDTLKQLVKGKKIVRIFSEINYHNDNTKKFNVAEK